MGPDKISWCLWMSLLQCKCIVGFIIEKIEEFSQHKICLRHQLSSFGFIIRVPTKCLCIFFFIIIKWQQILFRFLIFFLFYFSFFFVCRVIWCTVCFSFNWFFEDYFPVCRLRFFWLCVNEKKKLVVQRLTNDFSQTLMLYYCLSIF